MDSLVVDLAMHRLSNAVVSALKELEEQHSFSKNNNTSLRFEQMFYQGEITRHEYLLLQSRILLNEFCYKMEDKIGNDVVCGFLFYSHTTHKLYYGAGSNYPQKLKRFLHKRTPTVSMDTDHHYCDNEIFIVNTMDNWHDDWGNFAKIFKNTEVKSLISKRLNLNGITFGTFEMCFPYEDGPTPEVIQLIREEVQPVKEQLFHFRNEMVEVLAEMPDALIINERKATS